MWGEWESGDCMMFIVLLMMNLNVKKEIAGDISVCMCCWWNSMLKVDSEEKQL